MKWWKLILIILFFFFSVSKVESVEIKKVFAYVTNNDASKVSVIDTSTNQKVTDISVGSTPGVVAITPDGKKAYVTRGLAGVISVIDTSTQQKVTDISFQGIPLEVAFTPDGKRAYVNDNGIVLIDTATHQRLANVGDGTILSPHGLAVTPDGKKVYIVGGNDIVYVVDTASNLPSPNTIAVGSNPEGIAITPDGKKAYVTNSFSDNVSVIDISSNTPIKTIAVGTQPKGIAITPDGKKVYVANNQSAFVSVIDTDRDQKIKDVPVNLSSSKDVAITPDGKKAYVLVGAGAAMVSVIDIATDTLTPASIAVTSPSGIAITPLPSLVLSTSSITFPSQGVDPSNSSQTLTLTNTGNGLLTITSIVSSSDFSQTNSCGDSLIAGASCIITVTFSIADGTLHTGSLTLLTNASDSPTTIPLKGSLAAPAVGAGGCSLTQPKSNNFKFSVLLFLMSVGLLFLRRKRMKN